ncbi:MAG: hypothetical protein CO113_03155 [Elusimicrobia bacterium CG_4_9_14_3_um_filter_62_55]|nr:MAG: hypothetical protein COR54_08285 [Elusimicrobia bacterium CG22_combo_CG10-13_8_21_14_all_63_91]PJA15596.1 MAG: hypothetical protein COX66_09765 [Elusimicrobia bacterium CG_4_10_14_0_2_um_filter_63_34]PJB26529.1 MAG: hypothetical protein CO113_03155 [Elusimicrobia bacterium CG_4_9_14_3_um_filter_62_55]
MLSPEENHARALLGASRAYAQRAVELLCKDARLRDRVPLPLRPAIAAEIDRFHLFLIFSSLRDKEHRDRSFFERVHDSLRALFVETETRRLLSLREELAGVPEGRRIWEDLRPERDPLEPYYGSFDDGGKTLESSPFAIVARRVSDRFFREDAPVAYDLVLSIALDTADRLTQEVDNVDEGTGA